MARKKSRESWRIQQQQGGKKAATWLYARRFISTALVLSLVGVFVFLIILPILRPRSYFVYMTAAQLEPGNGYPIDYAFEDFDALTPVEPALTSRVRGESALVFTGLESPRTAFNQLDTLGANRLKKNDCVMVMLTAHGDVADDVPYLKCSNYTPANADQGRVKVADLLDRLAALPCGTKLLMLDVSRAAWEPERGDRRPNFDRLVAELVVERQHEGLWVMTSSRGVERSFVIPSLRQSVFGYVVSRGLRGAANVDDGRNLNLDEFYHFIRENVAALVHLQTDGHASQTPQLFYHDLRVLQRDPPVLLSMRKLPQVEAEPDIDADLDAARAADEPSMFARVANYMVGVSGQFGIPSPQLIKQRLRPLSGAAGRLLGSDEEEEEPAPEAPPANPSNPELQPDRVAARRLERAWQIVDQLEHAWSDDGASDPRLSQNEPPEVAPPEWHALKQRVLWYDRLHRAGAMVDQDYVGRQLQALGLELGFLAGEDSAPTPAPSSLANLIHSRKYPLPATYQEARSLGMVEEFARLAGQPVPEAEKAIIEGLDKLIGSANGALFDEWLTAAEKLNKVYDEIEFARQIRVAGLNWSQMRLVLSTNRLAEQVAAAWQQTGGWGRHAVESGDRARWEAERLLMAQNVKDWSTRARDRLLAADAHYREARLVHDKVAKATSIRHRAVSRCRDYIHWLSSRDSLTTGPQQQVFGQLCTAIRDIDAVLTLGVGEAEVDESQQLDELDRASRRLHFAYDSMENGLRSEALELLEKRVAGNAWRIETLKRTALLDAKSRQRLNAIRDDVSADLIRQFQFKRTRPNAVVIDTTMSDDAWKEMSIRMQVETETARLAGPVADSLISALRHSDQLESLDAIDNAVAERLRAAGFATVFDVGNATLDRLADHVSQANDVQSRRDAADAIRDLARWKEFNAFTRRLTTFYEALPDAMMKGMQSARRQSNASRLAGLKAVRHNLPLLFAPVELELDPRMEALQAEWYRYFARHAQRAEQASEDATADQLQASLRRHQHFVQLADEIPGFAPLQSLSEASLSIDAPTELSLETQSTKELFIELQSNITAESRVWIVLQYDTSKLSVTSGQPGKVYLEEGLRGRLAAEKSPRHLEIRPVRHRLHWTEYPYRPDVLPSATASVRVPGGGRPARFKLFVQQVGGARGKTDLIVKAVSHSSYIQKTVGVKLPGDQLFDLVIQDPETQQEYDREAWTSTNGGILMMPYPNRPQNIVFAVQDRSHRASKIRVELYQPTRRPGLAAVRSGAVDDNLARQVMGTFGSPKLLAKTEELTLPADESIPIPLAATQPGLSGGSPGTEGAQATLVNNGLLLVITDVERNQKTFKQIHFSVKRPERYMEAQASYDRVAERLTISLRVPGDKALPAGGIPAKLGFAEKVTFSGAMSPQLEMNLDRVGEWVPLLHAPIPLADRRRLTAQVAVDGFPRAFTFRVNCTETQRGIKPERNLKSVRIAIDKANEMISAADLGKTNRIPVRVQVDAPHQAFSEPGRDFVEVGIDRNKDGDLSDEQQKNVVLQGDRQVRLLLKEIGAVGNLNMFCDVDDFTVFLPASGLFNNDPYLLGRLTTGNTVADSPRPHAQLVVDGGGPRVTTAAVIVDGKATDRVYVDQDALVSVKVVDDMTHVVKVEVGFSRIGGDFSEVKEPFVAQPVKPGEWRAKGKVPPLALGKHRLWVKAVDAVGNVSEQPYEVVVSEPAKVVQPVAPENAGKPNDLKVPAGNGDAGKAGVKPGPKADSSPKPTTIVGRLRYGSRVVEDGLVRLVQGGKEIKRVKADPKGRFRITGVQPGEYSLVSRGVAGGNNVKGSYEVTIEGAGGGTTNVSTIQLR